MNVAGTDWHHSVDELRIEDGRLTVSGWLLHSTLGSEIRYIELALGKAFTARVRVQHGLPSPDVERAFGNSGTKARFAAVLDLPAKISLASFATGYLNVVMNDGTAFPLGIGAFGSNTSSALASRAIDDLKIGVGLTTFNRCEMLKETIAQIEATSTLRPKIFVSDDGSSDGTKGYLNSHPGIDTLCAPNRGIAWNKNRALFYLSAIQRCDVIILLEDDVQPERTGWDIEWVLAAIAHGHINYAPPWNFGQTAGNGRWHNPFSSGIVSGQCAAFTSESLSFVGFLDSRFGQYGHEHVEHTLRMIRAGYGGIQLAEASVEASFLLVNAGVRVKDALSSRDELSVQNNGAVFAAIWNESIYRSPWRNDAEMKTFRAEMAMVKSK